MKQIRIGLLTLLAALAGQVTVAAAADDLLSVYRQAVAEDRGLRAAAATLDAAREAIPQARSRLLPVASLGGDATASYSDPEGSDSDAYTSYGFNVRLVQPLFDRDASLRQDQAGSAVQRAEADFAAARQDLVLRTANGYFDILSAQATLESVLADKAAIERQLDQTRQRFEVGLIAITDVHEAQARYDNVLFLEIQARNGLDDAREALRVITGNYHADLADLADELPLRSPEPAVIDQWVTAAEAGNLALVAARHGIEVAKTEIAARQAGDNPTVDLVAAFNHSDSNRDFSGIRNDNASISVQLNLPFYTGGLVASRTREAGHDLRRVSEQYELLQRGVEKSTRDAFRNVDASIRGVEALRQAVVSSQSALDATQAGFEVGTRTIVDVLDAQRGLFLARRDFNLARYGYVLSTLALKAAVGRLDEAELAAVNRLLR